jgi:DNA polymerase III delta prime subunit
MSITNKLFWEKYRPKALNNMVLLPRIKNHFTKGIDEANWLLYGHSGTGKSTLLDILLKDKHCIKINANLFNGVDVLREKIMEFCDTMPSPFVRTDDKMKYVYLEEFEKTTESFQDAFKGFIESYSHKVRFLISMNDISAIKVPPLLGRFNKICFNPENDEERNYLINGYNKYLMSVIKHAKITVDTDVLKRIISTNFPDLRASVQDVQNIYITGDQKVSAGGNYKDIFDFMLNKDNDFSENFYFVMDNWVNQPRDLINILGRPLYQYLLIDHKNIIDKCGYDLLKLTKQYNAEFDTTTDPPLHVFSLICELKTILLK